jgi:glycosyltransferase involved in cell wall biosynthesis
MLKNRDIILISGIEWDSLWQGGQEIALRLAKAGNRVLYVENLGIRSPTWRDKKRVALRVKSWAGSLVSRTVRKIEENLFVCSPIVLPPFGSRWQRSLNKRLFLPMIAWAASSLGMRDPVLWTFLPTDTALDLIKLFIARSNPKVVYHCTADFSKLTSNVSALQESERELLRLSGLVFVTCRQLAEHCSPWNQNLHLFANGVSVEVFKNGGRGDPAAAPELSSIQRPIIGYIGGLHRFVDFALLREMICARSEWSWVFVGPSQTEMGDFGNLANVHLLGHRKHEELGRYLRDFDVCIVPYIISSATETIVPTKINEYLAAGKPVVSTELPIVCDFNRQHGVVTTAPSNAEGFLKAITESLGVSTDPRLVAQRTSVAILNDWKARLDEMSALIEAEIVGHNLSGLTEEEERLIGIKAAI